MIAAARGRMSRRACDVGNTVSHIVTWSYVQAKADSTKFPWAHCAEGDRSLALVRTRTYRRNAQINELFKTAPKTQTRRNCVH